MNIYLLKEYINRITKKDIVNFASKENISLNNDELDIIYYYVKNHYKTFIYGNSRSILNEIKEKVRPETYQKIEMLYEKYKHKLP